MAQVKSQDAIIDELTEELAAKDAAIASLTEQLRDKDAEIARQQGLVAEATAAARRFIRDA